MMSLVLPYLWRHQHTHLHQVEQHVEPFSISLSSVSNEFDVGAKNFAAIRFQFQNPDRGNDAGQIDQNARTEPRKFLKKVFILIYLIIQQPIHIFCFKEIVIRRLQ